MRIVVVAASVVAAAAFAGAAFLAVRMWSRARHAWPEPAPLILAAAMTLHLLVATSNFLEYSGVFSALDAIEDSAELLFVPLIFFTVYASEVQAASVQRRQAAHLLERQNDMLMGIVDMSPSGILVVAPGGHILFANEAAERILELTPSDMGDEFETPRWTLRGPTGSLTSLADLVGAEGVMDSPHVLERPDGGRVHTRLSVTPMSDAKEQLGGALVAIERTAAVTAASA